MNNISKNKLRLRVGLEIILLFIIIILFINLFNSIIYSNIVLLNSFDTIGFLIQEVVMIIIPIVIWKFLKRKPLKLIGITNLSLSYKDLILGFSMGSLSMIIVFLIIITFGKGKSFYILPATNLYSFVMRDLILFALVGFGEEILCRGYIVTILNEVENKYLVAFISSGIFSFMHILNPNITILSLLNIVFVGLLFYYMRFKFENIWMSIGYHITWNYFEGTIFGFQVSGITQESIYKTEYISSNIINGGSFGPEGGLAVTFVIILSFLILICVPKSKGEL